MWNDVAFVLSVLFKTCFCAVIWPLLGVSSLATDQRLTFVLFWHTLQECVQEMGQLKQSWSKQLFEKESIQLNHTGLHAHHSHCIHWKKTSQHLQELAFLAHIESMHKFRHIDYICVPSRIEAKRLVSSTYRLCCTSLALISIALLLQRS